MYRSHRYYVILGADRSLSVRKAWDLTMDQAAAVHSRLAACPQCQSALAQADAEAISVWHCLARMLDILDRNLLIDFLNNEVS